MKTVFLFAALVAAIVAVNGHPHPEFAVVQDDAGHLILENFDQEAVPETFFDPLVDTRYFLFTRQNRAGQQMFVGNADSIESSGFVAGRPTR